MSESLVPKNEIWPVDGIIMEKLFTAKFRVCGVSGKFSVLYECITKILTLKWRESQEAGVVAERLKRLSWKQSSVTRKGSIPFDA